MPRRDDLDQLLSRDEQKRIVAAIGQTERTTSGEIKVHIEGRCPGGDVDKRAEQVFHQLGLTKTRERNGVLIYVAMLDRKYAILGDAGIHAAVGSPFWQEAGSRMREAFVRGAKGDGIVGAVKAVGEKLARLFPPKPGDKNEIPDSISTSPSGSDRA